MLLRKEGGYAKIFFADGNRESVATLDGQIKVGVNGNMFECSTYTCTHCNGVVHVPPRADVNFVGMCRNCMQPICQRCSALPCEPFEKKLAVAEARDIARRSYEA